MIYNYNREYISIIKIFVVKLSGLHVDNLAIFNYLTNSVYKSTRRNGHFDYNIIEVAIAKRSVHIMNYDDIDIIRSVLYIFDDKDLPD